MPLGCTCTYTHTLEGSDATTGKKIINNTRNPTTCFDLHINAGARRQRESESRSDERIGAALIRCTNNTSRRPPPARRDASPRCETRTSVSHFKHPARLHAV